jgi:hypothetical protein
MNPNQQNNGGTAPNGKFFYYKIIDYFVVFECQIFLFQVVEERKNKKKVI